MCGKLPGLLVRLAGVRLIRRDGGKGGLITGKIGVGFFSGRIVSRVGFVPCAKRTDFENGFFFTGGVVRGFFFGFIPAIIVSRPLSIVGLSTCNNRLSELAFLRLGAGIGEGVSSSKRRRCRSVICCLAAALSMRFISSGVSFL